MSGKLTLRFAQQNQPWTVPYSTGVTYAEYSGDIPHILGSHCALHAAKSVGKIAAVFEKKDHDGSALNEADVETLAAMSADLVTAALRFANLAGFDLEDALIRRVQEKNGSTYKP